MTPIPTPTLTPTVAPTNTPKPTKKIITTPSPTPTLTPSPTPFVDEGGHTWIYVELPTQEPNTGRPPKRVNNWHTEIEDYETALGIEVIINQCGDCFD